MHSHSAASLYATPWLTDGAIRELRQLIDSRRTVGGRLSVLEFGSGGSTEVRQRLKKQQISNVDLRLSPLPYFTQIDALEDASFDIVLVDGRDRIECVRRSRSKLAPSGIFVVDNMERAGAVLQPGRYFEINGLLTAWPRKDHPQRDGKIYHNGAGWITTVWHRPA